MSVTKDFGKFVKEYKIEGIAIGFIIGAATNSLVKSLSDDILMPLITPFVAGGWRGAVFIMGPITLRWGAFLAALLNFVLIAVVVFFALTTIHRLHRKK